uniref:Spindle and kinetochore associated complex subunit 3 n=1 Tax=Podarcis muralis TaxID=64176 RepID=A0A670I0N5_PODMU|nr:spindle and kinetochore-associated protein 3 [Podarcis muralis]XP_028582142.1 spindle and kinetochore-associated protein 3 [Podarcis muralis]
MDISGMFFNKLRTLAVTVEKEAEQLKQIFQSEDTEFEEDSPMRYLHELFSEVRTLKSDADNTLCKSSSERDATYYFLKATKVLMKRTSTDLGKIRDFFQKYGYKPNVGEDAAKQDEAEINPESTSAEEEPKILDFPEQSSAHHALLQIPQLSDFGLSKYALPSTSGTLHNQPTYAQKEEPRVDYSERLSPKAEQFRIYGYKMGLNDDTTSLVVDQTIFLLNPKNSRQANNKPSEPAVELESNKNLATPKQKNKFCDDDYMASPAAPEFCTPGLKIPSRKDAISPESNKLDASNHMTETSLPDTESLITKPKQTCVPNNTVVGYGTVPPVPHSDKYLECLEPPSAALDRLEELPPPEISDYSSLFSSPPPPPEITVIPRQISQILSKYNPKVEAYRSLEKGTRVGIATQFEKQPVLDTGNKENRK